MSLNIRDVYNKKQQQETGGRSISEVYKNKKEEQENTQEDSKSSRSISNVYKEKTAQDTAWNIAERANKWVTDVNNLRSDYITRFGAENAGYRGDATNYFNSLTAQTTGFNTEAEDILKLMNDYSDYLDKDWMDTVTDMLSATSQYRRDMDSMVMNAYDDERFWSQWRDEDEYLSAVSAWEEEEATRKKYESYDAEKGAAKIERLKYYSDRAKELEAIMAGNATGSTPDELRASQGAKNKAYFDLQNLYAEYEKEFGVPQGTTIHGEPVNSSGNSLISNDFDNAAPMVDFDALLNEAEAFDTLARRYQNKQQLASASSRTDFAEGARQGRSLAYVDTKDIKVKSYGNNVFGYAPNELQAAKIALWLKDQGLSEGNYSFENIRKALLGDKAKSAYGLESSLIDKYFFGMDDKQFDILAYYLYEDSKNGTDLAEQYLSSIAEDVNQNKGNYDFESTALKDSDLLQRLYVIPAGIDSFVSGLNNIGTDEYTPPSPTQYTSGRVYDALADKGLQYYNKDTGKWEAVKIAGKSTSQLFYEANTSVVNMAPSIAVGVAAEMILPTAGEGAAVTSFLLKHIPKLITTGTTLGASAAGNARNEMLGLGYSKEIADNYGVLVGASETLLETFLSSIPGLSAGGGIFSSLGDKAIKAIGTTDNVLAKMAITLAKLGIRWTANGLDESLEEDLQLVLETWFKEEVTGADFDDPTTEEHLYSALLGYLTGAGFSVGGSAISGVRAVANTVSTGSTYKKYNGTKGVEALAARALEYDNTRKKAKKLQTQLNNGKKVSNYAVGTLVQNVNKSALQTSFAAVVNKNTAAILTDIVMGKEVSNANIKSILGDSKALQALNDVLGTNIKNDTDAKAVNQAISQAITKQTDEAINSLGKLSGPVRKMAQGELVSDKQIDSIIKNKQARDILTRRTGVEITEKSTVQEVKKAVIEASNDNYRAKAAATLALSLGMGTNGIRGIAGIAANSALDISRAVQAFNAVYQMGVQGKAMSDAKNPYLSELTMAQRLAAYEYGVMDGLIKKPEANTEIDEIASRAFNEKVDEKVAETKKEVTEEPTTEAEISRESEVDEGAIVTKGGETVVPVKENTKEQTRIIDMGKKLGVEVAFGKITKNGKNIDGLFDGKVLYINPKTTSGSAAYVLFKHEFTHFLEKSTKYINFAIEVTESKAFSEWLKKKGFKNSAEYYAQIIADYKQIGKNLEMGGAQKEAVANFCAEMLYAKDDSMQRFVDTLSADHKRTFGELIRDFIEWIKKKLGKVDEIAMLEKKYAEVFQSKRFDAKSFVAETKDTQANFVYAEQHKQKLSEKYSSSAAVDLTTLEQRYDKILEIWERLGGQLDSKFLNEWNSKIGKDRAFTVFKAQSGYKYNVELSSMCKKGVPLFEAIDTIVKEEAMKELKVNKLGKAEKEILYDLLKSDGFDIPCAICYVEQARQREGDIINAFLNGNDEGKVGWNQVLHEVEAKMASAGVAYTFPSLDRSVATDKYVPTTVKMTESEQNAFYEALKDIANREITKYNELHKKDKKFNPRKLVTSLTPAAINDVFKGNISSDLKIFKVLFQNPDSRFTIESDLLYASTTTHNLAYSHNALYSLFNQQGGVSGYKTKQGNVVYWGDILDKKWEASKLRKEGGIRYQSNSDSQMYTLLDQVQMFIDLTAKGYYLQSYSKVLSYLKLLGLSKGKINASLIPKVVVYRDADGNVDWARTQENAGLDENGNPIYDDIEGINHEEAFMLIKDADYSKSVGGVCIGYSDNHIRTLLDDSRIQLIIGFHDKTNNPDKRYRGARYAKNYNGINEAVDSEGKTVHIGFNQYVRQAEGMFTKVGEGFEGTTTHNGKTYDANDIPRLAADLYLEMCAKKGYAPAYNIEGIVDHKNYYKLLADFSLYDSKGNYAPHQKVEYNMPDQVPYLDENGHKRYMSTERYIRNELQKELKVRDDIAEKLADKSEAGLIPRFIKAVNREQIADTGKMVEDDTQLSYTPSERDTEYLDAVNRGDMETAQRMVDEAAKEAGYDSELLHHGTNKFGFTEIDVTQSDDGISFFATDKFDTASSYIPYYEDSDAYDKIREIGKKEGKKRKVLTSNSSIEEFLDYLKEVYPDWYSDSHIITEAERHKYAEWDVTDAVRHAKELLRYSLPENVEALANLVIDSEGDKSKWGDLAKAYKEFKDIPDITYRGNYFSEASHVWHSLQDNIRLLNLHLTHELAMVRNMPESKESLLYSYEQLTGGENVGIYGLYAKTEGQLVIRGRASNWNNIPLGDITAKFNEWWVNEKGHEPAENGYYTRGNTRNIAEFAKYTGYRSVCFVDIYDSGAYGGGHGDISTIYAFFYPNEDVKSADLVTYDDNGNIIPLSQRFNSEDADIRYSYTPDKEATVDELIAQYKDGRLTEEQFRDALVNKKQKTDPVSLANTKPEDFNTTPPAKRKTGENNVDGERDTIIARGASKLFSEEFKEEAKADAFIMRYKTIKNKDALREAAADLDENGEDGVRRWFMKPVANGASLNDVVKGYILLERYKETGDIEGQVAVAQKLSEMGTMGGQVVQSFTILSRFTPEGMLVYAQRVLNDVRQRMIETQSEAWLNKHAESLKLTDADIEYIYNRTILASQMPDGRDKQVMLAEIASRLLHKIPPAKGQSIKALQRISMLLNPKTIIRNVLGNVSIVPAHWLSDLIWTPVDMALSKISHKRVKGLRSDVKASMEASWNGMKWAVEDWLKDINTQENLDRFEIDKKGGGKSFYESGKLAPVARMLNAMDRLTSFTLAAGDRPFYEYWFSRSLTSQMAANKVTTPTAEMIEIATQEALERTWQDDNNVTAMVSKMKGALNTISIEGYGLGDVFIKFTKTPANLAKAIYDFSPVGFSTAARDALRFSQAVKSGKGVAIAQRNLGKSFSNAAAGTLLYVMAYALFKAGKLSGGSDEDKDVAAFEKWVQGIPSYSIKLFGKWFSYEWMQPIGSVAAIVSDYMEAKDTEGDDKLQPIVTALKSGGAVLYNQSFLKSFQTLFTADNIVDGFFEALLDDPSAFVPQIFSQIANVADKNRRTTFDKTSPIKSAINAIAYKIPGLRNTLTEDVDVFGRVVPNSQNNVGDAFFNPANTYVDTSDEVTNHVYGLYKALGNRSMIPAKAGYSIDINGTKYILNPEERAEYQTIMGSVSYKIIEGLLEDDFYNSYSPSEQEVVIKNVYAYANAVARANFNAKLSYELLKNYNAFLTRSKYDAMTEDEKREAYRNGVLKEYTDILDTDESGVVAYFVNKGTKTAIQNALYANNVEAAILALERGKENVGKYSDNEDDVKSYTSNMRSGVTNAMKEEYILAYYEGDEQRMAEIRQMLIDIGLYENVNKTLKEWKESVTK